MRRPRRLLLSALALAASGSVGAIAETAPPAPPAELSLSPTEGDWVLLGKSDEANAYYRADSIRTLTEGVVSIISKNALAKDGGLRGVRYRTQIGRVVIDCAAHRWGSLDSALLDAEGREVSSSHVPLQEVAFYATRIGDVADHLRSVACAAPPPIPQTQAPSDQPQLSTGTGWLTVKGYLITASHVIEGAERIELYQNGVRVGQAQVVTDDPANDVAVLRPHFKGARHLAIRLSPRPPLLGEPVFTIGYPAPDVLGESVKVTSGQINALAGNDVVSQRTDDVRLVQVSIPIQSGNSGGPVIDAAGQATGIVISKMERMSETEVAQNVNFALKASYVRGLLSELPDIGGYRLLAPGAGAGPLAARLQDAVFMIVTVSRPHQQ